MTLRTFSGYLVGPVGFYWYQWEFFQLLCRKGEESIQNKDLEAVDRLDGIDRNNKSRIPQRSCACCFDD
jgi:hypothetical protein